MTGRTHLLAGIAIGATLAATQTQIGLVLAAALAGGFGGLLPDIDHPKSIISGYTPGSGLLRMAISHRGPTHTLLFIALIAALCLVSPLPGVISLAFVAGMSLHLLCDMATPAGVRLLWPLSRRSWRVAPYRLLWAGSWFLEACTMVSAVGCIVATIIVRL